jgi:hypothetical protein
MGIGRRLQPAGLAIPANLPIGLASGSATALETLRRLLAKPGNGGLVFFVGAGGSAGQLPTAGSILGSTLGECAERTWLRGPRPGSLGPRLRTAADRLGFEITMNSLEATCAGGVEALIGSLKRAEETHAAPSPAHRMLSAWIRSGGHVITVNYDRLIEGAAGRAPLPVRYPSHDVDAPFAHWETDLRGAGTLFKLHGSLDDVAGCLATLPDVKTRISGHRADLLAAVIAERPLCVIGWSARDPDIPPVFREALAARPGTLPIVWVHHVAVSEWRSPTGLEAKREWVDQLTGGHPATQHLFTDVSRLIRGSWRTPPSIELEAADWVGSCTRAGSARFLAGTLRRLEWWPEAIAAAHQAERLAATTSERSAARQERAHILWARGRRRTALRVMEVPASTRVDLGDLEMGVTYAFGRASMSVALWASDRSTNLAVGPSLLAYAHAVAQWRRAASSPRERASVALHEALLSSQLAKARLTKRRRCGPSARDDARIAALHSRARRRMADAGDIHLHSAIDVAVAAWQAEAELGLRPAIEVGEIERRLRVLADAPRTRHWRERQLPELMRLLDKADLAD